MKRTFILFFIMKLLYKTAILILLLSAAQFDTFGQEFVPEKIEIKNWKFQCGSNSNWKKSEYDDTKWPIIKVPSRWEKAGYPEYDGYGTYRAKVFIPHELKKSGVAGLAFIMGGLDDNDSTFLNGELIGSTNRWNENRKYLIPLNNETIKWDAENTIVVQIYDYSGGGGMYDKLPCVATISAISFVEINNTAHLAKIINHKFTKKIIITTNGKINVDGEFHVSIINDQTSSEIYRDSVNCKITKENNFEYELETLVPQGTPCTIKYMFVEPLSGDKKIIKEGIPYLLTPPSPATPKFNGANIYGVRPGSPVILKLSVSGVKPITYSADNLPVGLSIDACTGIISGNIKDRGEYKVNLRASNSLGEAKKEFKFIVGDKISLTPPMGWNSWNCWGLMIDSEKIKAAADALIDEGLADYGWSYINIDDGWESESRNADGYISGNEKFPDMKALTDYVHKRGLKIGLYSSPGPLTCGGYLGSYGYEYEDVKTWAEWGFDYIKYDWCSYKSIKPNPTLDELKAPYSLVADLLNKQNRDIIFSICQYGMGDVWKWGNEVGGNLWRTTGDIDDTWESLKKIGFKQSNMQAYAKPGNWNDPDMLIVGRLGWGNLRPTRLSPSEQYTHISLWSLLASPLLIGCDLNNIDDFTKQLLCNSEVIGINQDALGIQATKVYARDSIQVWTKPLEDGNFAVGVFNLSENYAHDVCINFKDLGLKEKCYLRDVWRQKNVGEFKNQLKTEIPAHGVVLLKVSNKQLN